MVLPTVPQGRGAGTVRSANRSPSRGRPCRGGAYVEDTRGNRRGRSSPALSGDTEHSNVRVFSFPLILFSDLEMQHPLRPHGQQQSRRWACCVWPTSLKQRLRGGNDRGSDKTIHPRRGFPLGAPHPSSWLQNQFGTCPAPEGSAAVRQHPPAFQNSSMLTQARPARSGGSQGREQPEPQLRLRLNSKLERTYTQKETRNTDMVPVLASGASQASGVRGPRTPHLTDEDTGEGRKTADSAGGEARAGTVRPG